MDAKLVACSGKRQTKKIGDVLVLSKERSVIVEQEARRCENFFATILAKFVRFFMCKPIRENKPNDFVCIFIEPRCTHSNVARYAVGRVKNLSSELGNLRI